MTLALTLLINYLYGYTLNRVTLFALIFSIGILVDDAIVVVENIHRHFKLHKIEPLTAVLAVAEVGNPTILGSKLKRMLALGSVVLLLLLAITLVPLKKVTVKMLPFDNKSELQVIIDMPEGKTLEETAAMAREMGEYLKTVPEVTDYQTYVGTAAPYNFNGLVRHYFLRTGSTVADLQVNFVAKEEAKIRAMPSPSGCDRT